MEREMICIPLEEYKELLRAQGEARILKRRDNTLLKLMSKIKYIIYTKYILGQCRHSCLLCKFRNECFDNLEV